MPGGGCVRSDPQLFGETDFGLVEDFFETGKAGEWKALYRNGAHFSDGPVGLQRRSTAFFVDEGHHGASIVTRRNSAIGSGPLSR